VLCTRWQDLPQPGYNVGSNQFTNEFARSPNLGVPLLHAYPEIGKWCLASSVAIAFGSRLGGTLHLAGL